MKYIVLDSDSTVLLFSDFVKHSYVANGRKVKSAGFCVIEVCRDETGEKQTKVSVFGNSTSLNLGTQAEDVELIKDTVNATIF